jgi:hypothetical protein
LNISDIVTTQRDVAQKWSLESSDE